MADQSESLAEHQGISEEVRVALELVDIKFWGYRQDHMLYQFVDTITWRCYYIDPEHMNDQIIKSMLDDVVSHRAK